MPTSIRPRVVMDVPEYFAVGVTTDFSIGFTPGDMEGTMVQGVSVFPAGSYTAWYYEPQTSEWIQFQGSSDGTEAVFGGASGFPLQDATSYFRVRFDEEMKGTFVVRMKEVETGEYLAQNEAVVQAVTGLTIDEVNERLTEGGVLSLETDVVGTISIANSVTIKGNGHTVHGNVMLDATSATSLYDVTLDGIVFGDADGQATRASGFAIFGQNQTADTPVRPVNLVVRDCHIKSYTNKAIYITNAKSLNLIGNTFGDIEGEPVCAADTYGDYAVDVNLCGVTNAAIRMVNNTFTATCGGIGAVKIAQRGGIVDGTSLTDDRNDDIPNPTSATITSCVIQGNDFSAMNGDATLGQSVIGYVYDDYTYVGTISASGGAVSVTYDSTITDLMSDPTDVVNDLDYMLGALYRGAGVTAVEWNGTGYTWSGSRAASNWVNGSNQLTSDIVSWVLANIQSISSPSISMTVTLADGSTSAFVYALGLGSADAGSAAAFSNIVIGAGANDDGSCRTYCQAFPVSVTSAGTTIVNVRGSSEGDASLTMPNGTTVTLTSTLSDDGTYEISIDASEGVTVSGSLRDGAVMDTDVGWTLPDGGPVGLGFNGLRRLIMRGASVEYPAGGFLIPAGFRVVAVLEASVEGGVMSWYDRENDRLVLYSANGVEVSGTLTDVTIVLVGTYR